MPGITAFQTIGPFFDVLLRSRTPIRQAPGAAIDTRIAIEGVLYDGGGQPIRDGLVETWQADGHGRYPRSGHGSRQESDPEFFGYGWSRTEDDGRFRFDSIKPGPVAAPDGRLQAPHILVSVMARGILTRYITRMYFEDEAANESDPILERVPAARRQTLVARRVADGAYQFDIRVQGPDETVFFDV